MKHKTFVSSEEHQKITTAEFVTRLNPARYAQKTREEKEELKKRIKAFPNRNGTPVGYNPL